MAELVLWLVVVWIAGVAVGAWIMTARERRKYQHQRMRDEDL